MQRKQDGLVPIGEALSGLGGPVKALREATPQARLLTLCSLPRSNPGNRIRYVRRNGLGATLDRDVDSEAQVSGGLAGTLVLMIGTLAGLVGGFLALILFRLAVGTD